jgi:LPXTG-site transpeptidase (sortase) family protein
MDQKLNKIIKETKHSRNLLGMLGFLVLIFLIGFGYAALDKRFENQKNTISYISNKTTAMEASKPVKLKIEKIGIDANIVELGLQPDGSMEVPDNGSDVGWYNKSPTPGELGPSVIAGHYDTPVSTAVFYKLDKLESGDEILLQREDGSTAKFVVEKTEEYEQTDFPTLQVYGPTTYPALRLITCAGKYQSKVNRYSHNLVVYARLVE